MHLRGKTKAEQAAVGREKEGAVVEVGLEKGLQGKQEELRHMGEISLEGFQRHCCNMCQCHERAFLTQTTAFS